MKNKENASLSTKEWIFSILGIIVLSCFIILPPVFRVVFKVEEVVEDIPTEIDIKTLVCTKNNYYSDIVRKSDTYTIKYYKDKVRTYNIKLESIYPDTIPYEAEKEKEGRLSTAYGLVEGISYKVNPNDSELRITTEEDCDLSVFMTTNVILPGDEAETKINSVFTTKDSVQQIRMDLEDQGFSCQ